jgi:hypothetical protein
MKQFIAWPPPGWTEVVIKWDDILNNINLTPQDLYNWADNHNSPGRYHVYGWRATKGFAFGFENPTDATAFALKWL